ncbi:hypothetical protein AB0F18_32290 [Streptomyces sp. NPDC029216]|uniref:hypothetical protein n=1 Tax=Streptomyces sp. NPDC029216 TaxID=3154701 RepID=UPI0033FDC731
MIDEADVWDRFAALLPEADAHEVRVCWEIGEQEAGIDLLVGALHDHRVPIGEATRAEMSVIAETWGVRLNVAARLMECPGDGLPSPVELLPETAPLSNPGHIDSKLGDFLLIPWIRHTASGRLLVRAHVEAPWGDLSYIPEYYPVLASEQGPSLHLFDSCSAREALEALLHPAQP